MNGLTDTILNMMDTTQEPEDYIGEDGLLHCGKCHKPKEAYFPQGRTLFGRDRHPSECDCRRAECERLEKRDADEKHNAEVERLKREGFSNPAMRHWTFENDNGKCPQIGKAHSYVEKWETVRSENLGYLLWGNVGSGKSYFAGCITNALMEKEIPVCMMNFATILNNLFYGSENRNEYIVRLCSYPLLILDDFGICDSLENGVILLYNRIRTKANSEFDILLEETDIDGILKDGESTYAPEVSSLVEKLAQDFVNDLANSLRERMLDLMSGMVVFVGGGAILLRRQIEASGKVGNALFVEDISANAKGYEFLYKMETTGR